MNRKRNDFEIFMDVLVVFYEYNNLKATTIIRKANLNNSWQREIIDQLLVAGIIGVDSDNFLFLNSSFEDKLNGLIVSYKKSKELFSEVCK